MPLPTPHPALLAGVSLVVVVTLLGALLGTLLPSSSPSPSPSSVSSSSSSCHATNEQCGGSSLPAGTSTCCARPGDYCVVQSAAVWKCVPLAEPAPTATPCQGTYAQCGGQSWTGPTCCANAADACTKYSDWYSQCVPRPNSGACLDTWAQCGGRYYTGASCCARPGDVCLATSEWYAQCVPSSGLPTVAPTTAAPTTKPTTKPTAKPTASPTSPPDFGAYVSYGDYGAYYPGEAPPATTTAPLPNKPAKPNVLLMYADDLRLDIPPYNPDIPIVMPNFAAFAQRSLTFTNHYTAQPVCGPARASLLSGRRPDVSRMWNFINTFRDAPSAKSLPEVFRDNGYVTRSIGKVFHYQGSLPAGTQDDARLSWNSTAYPAIQDGGNCPGVVAQQLATGLMWCSCDGPGEDPCDDTLIANDAVATLQSYAANGTSFFLAVGFRRPHTPFSYPESVRQEFIDVEVKLPKINTAANFSDVDNGGMPSLAFLSCATANTSQIYSLWLPDTPLPDDMVVKVRREYYTSIKFLDMNLGRVLTALSETGLESSTMVIFVTDHGYHLGERNMYCKAALFEATTHVPLIFHVPWLERASTANIETNFVEGVDVMPTVISLVLGESKKPPCLSGRDLSPTVRGEYQRSIHRGWSISQFPRCPGATLTGIVATNFWSNPCSQVQRTLFKYMGYSIRTRNWRYTEWRNWNASLLVADWSPAGLNASELYDHRGDTWNEPGVPSATSSKGPGYDTFEGVNVVKRFPAIVAKMSALLRKAALERWADPDQYPSSCILPSQVTAAAWAGRA